MNDKVVLDEKLVHLKQKLEILQSTFLFLFKVDHGAALRNNILEQIVRDVEPLITKELV